MATHTSYPQRELNEQYEGPIRQSVRYAVDNTHEIVERRPLSSAAVVFGAGFGVGILIGCALADNSYSSRGTNRSVEAFGNRILERVANLVPDAVAQQFHR